MTRTLYPTQIKGSVGSQEDRVVDESLLGMNSFLKENYMGWILRGVILQLEVREMIA